MRGHLLPPKRKMVSSLERFDLLGVCLDGYETGFVTSLVKETFHNLDDNVSRFTKVRYLCLHVCQQVRENPGLKERVFTVFSKYGVDRDVLERLGLNQVDKQTSRGNEKVCDGRNDIPVVGKKRPHNESKCFSEKHISVLTEVLAKSSHKWQEISLYLNIPHYKVKEILSTVHMNSIEICLSRVLREWIVGNHEYAMPPTVESLQEALGSNIVGLGDVANNLQCLLQRGGYLEEDESSTAHKRPHLDTAPLEVVSQTRDCVVREEKSTLLEVQVYNTSSLSYQWMKDGSPLTDSISDGYSGTETEILCINNASLSSEGTYSCQIKCNEDQALIHSRPVVVTVKMSPLKKVLIDIYDSRHDVPEDSWPPVTNNTYINLALIKSGNIDNANEYTRYTFQNDMDDIYNNKDRTEYEEVFSDLPSGSRLLIEGRPGSGKTTLVHKFSQDWARNKLSLKNVKFVFLVHLRGFFSSPDIQISDIITKFYADVKKAKQIISYLEEYSGEGLCFVIDGLDEYCPKNKKNTQVFRLINKEIYPKAVVIVASRPAATAPIRKVASKRVEVLGFLKEQISQYIDSYNFKSPGTNIKLRASLDQRQNVERMCYLPIHAVMVCYLFDLDGFLPRTETEMYTQFIIQTLLRTLSRSGGRKYLAQVEDLPNGEKEVYLEICKLSYEKTVSSKQVMKRNEVEHFLREVDSGNESLGLITVDHMAEKCGFQDLYTFLHLTHQEYLAAYHISKLEEKEQAKVVEKYGKKKHMLVVWKFYCGLVDFTDQVTRFKEIVNSTNFKDDLISVQCAFESQQTITCDYLATLREESSLIFRSQFLTPSDFTVIGYVISKATHPVNKLVLDRCNFRNEGVGAFLEEVGEKISLIKTLCFHGRNFVKEQFKSLNSLLKELSSLEELDITRTEIGPHKMEIFTNGLSLLNLKTIRLPTTDEEIISAISRKIVCPGVRRIFFPHGICNFNLTKNFFGALPAWNSITAFSIVNITHLNESLSYNDVEMLSAGLRENLCCTSLILTNCNIDDRGAKILADSIAAVTCFKVLKLSINNIGDEGATALAESVRYCTQICGIDLSFNHITDIGALAIAGSLRNLTNLKELDMRFNFGISRSGNTAIAKAIMGSNRVAKVMASNSLHFKNGRAINEDRNSLILCNAGFNATLVKTIILKIRNSGISMQILNLESNCIGSDGAKVLTDGLRHHNNLQTLNLWGNRIGTDGAKALSDFLKHCNNLQTLNLGYNRIGSDGAKALADGLKHCSDLQTLDLKDNIIGSDGSKVLFDGLKHCVNLKALYLSNSSVGSDGAKALADGLKYYNNLQTLNLDKNSIGSNGARTLADGLIHCNNLQTLNLENNTVGSDGAKTLAHGLIHCNNLHTLNLRDNNIGSDGAKVFANCLKYSNYLQILDFGSNSICSDGVKALVDCLRHCSNLQTLNLRDNSISSDGAKAIANGLKFYKNLHTLNLGDNSIGCDGAMALANDLKHGSNNLQILDLKSNSIGSDGSRVLVDGLKHCSNLQTLNLRDNYIGPDGTKVIADGLKHLQALNLSDNRIGFDGVKALADSLEHLQTLNLSNNSIDFNGAKALADGLKHHCNNLQELNLGYNSLGSNGVKALADGLKHCNNLETLDLAWNNICSDGAKALAGLKHCSNLQTLILDYNYFSCEGAKALVHGLKHCNNLHTLNISHNTIGLNGAKALADGLKHCNNLQILDLESNKIGSDGANALADGLKHCNNLHMLNLTFNAIGNDGAKALADGLKHCNNLHTLKLRYNSIDFDDAVALIDGLKHCNIQVHTEQH